MSAKICLLFISILVLTACVAQQSVTLIKVVDGDTIVVQVGQNQRTVRYAGIDTPEVGECYYQEATERNIELLSLVQLRLEKDVSEVDRYDRLLRHVWVDDMLVSEVLVREGYAIVDTYSPDTRYVKRFLVAQGQARGENKGLWSACS